MKANNQILPLYCTKRKKSTLPAKYSLSRNLAHLF